MECNIFLDPSPNQDTEKKISMLASMPVTTQQKKGLLREK